jgi:outer membrane protein W
MKKLFFTSLTLSFCVSAAQAQNIYIRGALGFAIANAGQTVDDGGSPYSGSLAFVSINNGASTALSSFQMKSVSFNTGIQGSVALGYMFTKNVGVELGTDIGLAHIEHEGNVTGPSSTAGYTFSLFYSQYVKNPVILTPALCLQAGGKKINIYTRAGIAAPLRARIITEIGQITTAVGTNASRSANATFNTTTSFSLGLSGAAGVKYAVNPRLQLGLEISGVSLSLYPNEVTYTSYSENGVDLFSRLPEHIRRRSYGKTGSTNILPAYSIPFSNVALRAGVFYTLR